MLIVFNPAAGRRRIRLLWRVLDVMTENGVKVQVAETQYRGHARNLAREAAERGQRLIVAAGGDGTIAEVANGINGSPCALGVIPLGTANVLANELGLPFEARAIAAALAFRRTRPVWPGLAVGAGSTRLFVQMIGAGFDAQVVHHLPAALKRSLGRNAYVVQGVREALRYGFAPIRVRVDGAESEAASVIVTKGRLYGGRYLLAPEAQPSDPGFTVALFERTGAVAALLYGAALVRDRILRMPGLRLVRANQVEIASADVPAQADGDAAGCAPFVVINAPSPIRIIVS